MYHYRRLNSDQSFFQKIKNLDYILLICILALSTLSFFIMYSTDGGEFLYHSKSHLIKLVTFFILYSVTILLLLLRTNFMDKELVWKVLPSKVKTVLEKYGIR